MRILLTSAEGTNQFEQSFRCDAAPYASDGGCTFHEVEAVMHYHLTGHGVDSVASHIKKAQDDPANVYPGGIGTEIPGGKASGKPLTPGELFRAGRGGVVFRSGAFDHFARVRVELWPARPPRPPVGWEETAEGVTVVDSTALGLASVTAWVSSNPIRLPMSGAYSVQGAVSGRTAVHDRMLQDRITGTDEPPRGIERWLVQLWPAPHSDL